MNIQNIWPVRILMVVAKHFKTALQSVNICKQCKQQRKPRRLTTYLELAAHADVLVDHTAETAQY